MRTAGSLLILVLCLLPQLVPAQLGPAEQNEYFLQHYTEAVFNEETEPEPENEASKPFIHFQAGSSVMFPGTDAGGFQSWVRPALSMDMTPGLRMTAGVQFSTTHLSLTGFSREGNPFLEPVNRISVFASGEYLVSERLTVFGSALKDLSSTPVLPLHSGFSSGACESLSLGFNYRLTENIRFGAQLRISDQPYSRYRNPYRASPWGQPSLFGPGF